MNYFQHVSLFFKLVENDKRLQSHHICIYTVLLHFWNTNRFEVPISISKEIMLQYSKIGSTHTYYKRVRELHSWGYLIYEAGKNGIVHSKFILFEFSDEIVEAIYESSVANLTEVQNCTDANSTLVEEQKCTSSVADLHSYSSKNATIYNTNTYIHNNIINKDENCIDEENERKKVAAKKESLEVSVLPFSSEKFLEKWQILMTMPKWKKKPPQSIKSLFTRIAKYEEDFIILLIESAIEGNWQGLLFPNTEELYKNYLQAKGFKNENTATRTGNHKTNNGESKEITKNYKLRF